MAKRRCPTCKRWFTFVGKSRYCPDCAAKKVMRNARALKEKRGKLYEAWLGGMMSWFSKLK